MTIKKIRQFKLRIKKLSNFSFQQTIAAGFKAFKFFIWKWLSRTPRTFYLNTQCKYHNYTSKKRVKAKIEKKR